jgi:hypothetical protein
VSISFDLGGFKESKGGDGFSFGSGGRYLSKALFEGWNFGGAENALFSGYPILKKPA